MCHMSHITGNRKYHSKISNLMTKLGKQNLIFNQYRGHPENISLCSVVVNCSAAIHSITAFLLRIKFNISFQKELHIENLFFQYCLLGKLSFPEQRTPSTYLGKCSVKYSRFWVYCTIFPFQRGTIQKIIKIALPKLYNVPILTKRRI